MKKLLFCIALLVFINVTYSQTTEDEQKTSIDSMIVNLDTSALTSSFLYDRTSSLTDLKNFNTSEKNTATLSFFEQALEELYNASNQQKFMSYKSARQFYKTINDYKNVEIGIIHADFQSLNYNDDATKSAFKIEDKKLIKINEKPLFIDHEILIAAPLLEYAIGPDINFHFKSDLWFEDSNNPIQSLVANFSVGSTYAIYTNARYTQKEISISYTEGGLKTITFIATFQDGTTKTTYGKIHVKLANTEQNRADDLIDNGTIVSTIPFQGYDEPSPVYGQIDYRIFYHTNNNNAQRTLLKPIIIIDGFDPEDKRKIQDSDSPLPSNDHRSIDEIMSYFENGNLRKLIPLLRELGYDVVIVNHPKYIRTINGSEKTIDGGADYIERNGLNHVTFYNYLNSTLLTNGSSEQLVIVGPSMGGQISRYALSYMEKNNMSHNVRLWVSIDSPHLGANIPIGAQALINLLNDVTDSVGAADFVDNWLGSAAARQQLIEQYNGRILTGYLGNIPMYNDQLATDHFNAKTVSQGYSETRGHPFFTQFYNNLYNNGQPNSKGYPQNTRKIAIINGSLAGKKEFQNPFGILSIDPISNPRNDVYAPYGAKVLKIEGNANVIGHIVTIESYFAALTNYNHKLAYFKKKKLGGWDYYHRYGDNINYRGNLDNV